MRPHVTFRHSLRRLRFLSLLLVFTSSLASAQNRSDVEAADRAFREALALMDGGRYSEACTKLEASDRLAPASGTLLNLADCYEHLGRIGSAWKAFEGAAARAKTNGKQERERVARERAASLVPRLSRLVLVAPAELPAGLALALDGEMLAIPAGSNSIVVDPGAHALVASAPERQSYSATLGPFAEGQTITFRLPNLAHAAQGSPAAPEPAASTSARVDGQRVGAIVSAGVGVVGIVAGTAFGLHSLARHNESVEHCERNPCQDPRGVSAMDEARTAGDRATAGFIIGAAGLAAASVLWFVRPFSSEPRSETQVGVGPNGVVVRGTF
jgi:tetratricopeptide (TPR) repeat protein